MSMLPARKRHQAPRQRCLILAAAALTLACPRGARAATNVGGTMSVDTTWTAAGSPDVLTSNVSVAANVTLTLQPGVIVKALNTGLSIADTGRLIAQGTASEPIVFTSLKDDSIGGDTNGDGSATTAAPGDWGYTYSGGGISFQGGSAASPLSLLDYVTIRYARYGLYANGLEAGIAIAHSTVTQNLNHGLELDSIVGAAVTDSTLSNNGTGVYSGGSSIQMTGNTLTQNTTAVSASAMSQLTISGNTVSDNGLNGVDVTSTQVTADWTWKRTDLPYVLRSGIGVTVANGATLTLEPGVVVKGLTYGLAVTDTGRLIAQGTASEPIVFTSLKDDSIGGDTNGDGTATTAAPGDWGYGSYSGGISFQGGAPRALSRLGLRHHPLRPLRDLCERAGGWNLRCPLHNRLQPELRTGAELGRRSDDHRLDDQQQRDRRLLEWVIDPDDRKHARPEHHGRLGERHEPADLLGQHGE